MNEFFDYEEARTKLKALYQRDSSIETSYVARASAVKAGGFTIQTIQYPPSVRLMVNEEGEFREITMKAYGVLCGAMLPPFIRDIRPRSLTSIRNLRQQVKITSLGEPAFDDDVLALNVLRNRIQAHVGSSNVGDLDFVPYEGYPCLEAHARYFTDRKHVPYDRNIPFPHVLDPNRILSDLQPPSFIRAPDNCVEYCKESVETDGKLSYAPIDPSLIKGGDLVEIAFVCVGVPVKDQRYRVLLTLRAVTLISDKLRKDSEAKSHALKTAAVVPGTLKLKRRRLYVDMDAPVDTSPFPKRCRAFLQEQFPTKDSVVIKGDCEGEELGSCKEHELKRDAEPEARVQGRDHIEGATCGMDVDTM